MRIRRIAAILALGFALTGGAGQVAAQGVTPETLADAGWECFPTPPFVVPPNIVCAPPGVGRPTPGDPDPRPTFALMVFDINGGFIGTRHLIRADLYAGQPCHTLHGPYVFRPVIGYYECTTP